MHKIILKKGGSAFHENGTELSDLLPFLGYTVELEEGFTLRDMFIMIECYPGMERIDPYLIDYLEEFENCPESGCFGAGEHKDGMDAIYVQRVSNYTKNNKYEDKDTFNIYYYVGGRSTDPEAPGWAIEYSPLSDLLDYPIVLLDQALGCEDHNVSVLVEKYEYYKTTYTLWEVVHAIIWELSFYGTPSQRNNQREELYSTISDIEDGNIKTIPWEELKSKLLTKNGEEE